MNKDRQGERRSQRHALEEGRRVGVIVGSPTEATAATIGIRSAGAWHVWQLCALWGGEYRSGTSSDATTNNHARMSRKTGLR